MAKSPFDIVLSEEESRELRSRAARYTVPHHEVLQANIVVACHPGQDQRGDCPSPLTARCDGVVVAETLLRGAAGRSSRSTATGASPAFSPRKKSHR